MDGKSGDNQCSNNDQEINLDLTLRLGGAPVDDTKNLEENKNVGINSIHGFSGIDYYAANDKGNFPMHGNVGFGGAPSIYGGSEVGYIGGAPSIYGGSEVGYIGAPYIPLATHVYAPDTSNFAYYQGLLPPSPSTPTRKRKTDDSKNCQYCGVNSTPLWRKGPDGPQTLCNACGLRHLRTVKKDGE